MDLVAAFGALLSDDNGASVAYDAWAPTLASAMWYVAGLTVGFLVGRWEPRK